MLGGWFSGSGKRRSSLEDLQDENAAARPVHVGQHEGRENLRHSEGPTSSPYVTPRWSTPRQPGTSGASTPKGRTAKNVAGIHATLVPAGWGRPHMIESMGQGGPAHASGMVQPGDLVLEVNGEDVSELALKDIQDRIVGEIGSKVTLTLQRGEKNFAHKVILTRKPRGMFPSPRAPATKDSPPEIREGQKELQPTTPRSARGERPDERDMPRSARGQQPDERDIPRSARDDRSSERDKPRERSVEDRVRETSAHYSKHMRPRSAEDAVRGDVPRPLGVPPLFRDSLAGGAEHGATAVSQESEEDEEVREQELSARADYWKEQYKVLEKKATADVDLREQVSELQSKLRKAREDADADKMLFKRTIQHLEEKQKRAEEALEKGSADEELKNRLHHLEQVLEETKKQRREEEEAKKEAVEALHELQAQESMVRKHLEQKLKKSEQQLADARKQMDEYQQQLHETVPPSSSALPATNARDDKSAELKLLRAKVRELESRLAEKEEEERRMAGRVVQLEGEVKRLQTELSDAGVRREGLEQEAQAATRELSAERRHGDEHKHSLELQLRKVSARLEEVSLVKAETEKRCARLEEELKEVEKEAQDTVAKLQRKLEVLEERESKAEAALTKARAASEHAQTDVARRERELDVWKVKGEQAEARKHQLEVLLKRKQDELERAQADAAAERSSRKLTADEAEDMRRKIEAYEGSEQNRRRGDRERIAELEREVEASEAGRKKAEAGLEELTKHIQALKSGTQALGERAEEAEAQLAAVEGLRERAAAEAAALRGQMSQSSKEALLGARALEDEMARVKEELRSAQEEAEAERREKLEALRELTDLKGEKRRADRLQRKLQDAEEKGDRDRTAHQDAQEELEKTRKYADNLAEWDRALREKLQRLEARLEKAENCLDDEKRAVKSAEDRARALEEDLTSTATMLADANKQCLDMKAKVDDAMAQCQREVAQAAIINQAMDALALDHRKRGDKVEDLEGKLQSLMGEFDRERAEARNSTMLSNSAERELGMLKRNLARAEEIIDEERAIRKELQDALERAKAHHVHHHHHDSPTDATDLKEQMERLMAEKQAREKTVQRLIEEKEEAEREVEEARTKLGERRGAPAKHDPLAWSDEAQEALLFANSEIRRLEDEVERTHREREEEVDALRRASKEEAAAVQQEMAAVRDKLYAAHEQADAARRGESEARARARESEELGVAEQAVAHLSGLVRKLEDDNARLQKALSDEKTRHERSGGAEVREARQSEQKALAHADAMERKLEELLSLQQRHHESISIRLEHTLEDHQEAVERAERAEVLLVEREAALQELRMQSRDSSASVGRQAASGSGGRLLRAR